MASCPNCGKKLHLYNWQPDCPSCGVNINYFDINNRMLEESEKAEIEHSHFQPKVDRAKAAYAGSKLAIARIVISVLTILPLLLPVVKLAGAESKSINAIDIYNFVSSADVGTLLSGAVSGNTVYLALVFVLLALVGIIVSLVLILMSLGKHGKVRVLITYGLIALFAVLSVSLFAVSAGKISSFLPDYASASLGIGAYLFIVFAFILLGWNIMLVKKGIPVNYKECLIGGIPSAQYFEYVEQGMSRDELNRKMLKALAELQEIELAKEKEEEGADNK